MGLRVCLVTPFAWSRPHDVNEHVAGIADGLRALGHTVTVLAPSTRAADLIAGRRALLDGGGDEVIALGPAVPVSRRSRDRRPGRRAGEPLARARQGRLRRRPRLRARPAEPLVPGSARLARARGRDLPLARAARLPAGPGAARAPARADRRARRDLGGDRRGREPAPARGLPRHPRRGSTPSCSGRPRSGAWSSSSGDRASGRSTARSRGRCASCPAGSSSSCGRSRSSGRPTISRSLRGRARVRTLRDGASRATLLNEAAIFVPAFEGLDRVSLEAAAAGAAIASPAEVREQPELAAAEVLRLAEDEAYRERRAAAGAAGSRGPELRRCGA